MAYTYSIRWDSLAPLGLPGGTYAIVRSDGAVMEQGLMTRQDATEVLADYEEGMYE